MAERREERAKLAPILWLAGIVVLAIGLRFWRLGDWGFEGDEIFTMRDSLGLRLSNPRPLLYWLNHYIVQPLVPLDELGLRLIPAIAGVLSVAAIYYMTQRLAGTRAALFAALLLAVNPTQVYQSQYARYWSLVFLLSAMYPYALFLGARDRNIRWVIAGLVLGVLAVLAHPVSVLLVGGLGLFLLLRLRRDVLAEMWTHRAVRWLTFLSVLLLLAAALRSFDMLQHWIVSHDASTRIPDHLRDAPRGLVIRQLAILLALVDGLTLPVALTGAIGIYLLWQQGSHSLALFLICVLVVPVAVILAVSIRTPVSVTYLTPATPVAFIAAGIFLDRLADLRLRHRGLLPATVTALVIVAGMPTLISQYRDGRRWNLRGAAHWLEPRLSHGDVVFSVQSVVMAHYLRSDQVRALAPDRVPLMQSARQLRQAGRGQIWIVAPAPSHAFRTNLRRGDLIAWIYDSCQLRNSIGVGRLDFRQQYLHIYRCAPDGVGPAGAGHRQAQPSG